MLTSVLSSQLTAQRYSDAAKTQQIGSCLRDCWGGYTCDDSTSPYTTTNRYRCDC